MDQVGQTGQAVNLNGSKQVKMDLNASISLIVGQAGQNRSNGSSGLKLVKVSQMLTYRNPHDRKIFTPH